MNSCLLFLYSTFMLTNYSRNFHLRVQFKLLITEFFLAFSSREVFFYTREVLDKICLFITSILLSTQILHCGPTSLLSIFNVYFFKRSCFYFFVSFIDCLQSCLIKQHTALKLSIFNFCFTIYLCLQSCVF